MYEQLINKIAEAGKSRMVINEGDYYNDENCLICGTCGKKKETIIEMFGKIKKVSCVCKCWQDEQDRIKAENERFLLEKRIKEYRRIGFSSSEMRNWTFATDDGKTPEMTAAMKRYAENFTEMKAKKQGLLLHGGVGAGKSFYAACIANYLIDKGIPVLMTNFIRISNTINERFEGRQSFIDSLSKYDLLILDDLGAERQSDFMNEQVFNIIDARYRTGLPLIVTTNISFKEIGSAQDIKYSRIYDRLIEMCYPIEIKGESRRKLIFKDEYKNMRNFLGV